MSDSIGMMSSACLGCVFPNTAVCCSLSCVELCPDRFTARIVELMKVLKDLNAGKYERTMVSQQEKGTRDS